MKCWAEEQLNHSSPHSKMAHPSCDQCKRMSKKCEHPIGTACPNCLKAKGSCSRESELRSFRRARADSDCADARAANSTYGKAHKDEYENGKWQGVGYDKNIPGGGSLWQKNTRPDCECPPVLGRGQS